MSNKNFYKKLGKRIKELRLEKNLTQSDLAEIIDMHYSYPGEIERAEKKPSLDTIIKLANAFSIKVSELFNGL